MDLGALVRRVLDRQALAGVGLLSELSVDDGAPSALGDPDQLQRAFENLVRNASEAGDGEVRLRVEIYAGGPGRVDVRFEDNGPGIPAEEVARLFQPFRTTKRGGTGLGWEPEGSTSVNRIVLGGFTPNIQRNPRTVDASHIRRRRAQDAARIELLEAVRDPAGDPTDRERGSEELRLESEPVEKKRRVEFDVGLQSAAGLVLVYSIVSSCCATIVVRSSTSTLPCILLHNGRLSRSSRHFLSTKRHAT